MPPGPLPRSIVLQGDAEIQYFKIEVEPDKYITEVRLLLEGRRHMSWSNKIIKVKTIAVVLNKRVRFNPFQRAGNDRLSPHFAVRFIFLTISLHFSTTKCSPSQDPLQRKRLLE